MNNTNRGLNRFGIFLFGFVLLAVCAAVGTAAAIPTYLKVWKSVAGDMQKGADQVVKNTALGGLGQSWMLILIPVTAAILIGLLIVFIFRQGHGHTRTLIHEKASTRGGIPSCGSVIIDGKIAEQAIQQALDGHPGLVSSNVTTWMVRKTATLSITANVCRGISPHQVRIFIDDIIAALDGVLGRDVPVIIQITAGLATRMTKSTRLAQPQNTAELQPIEQ